MLKIREQAPQQPAMCLLPATKPQSTQDGHVGKQDDQLGFILFLSRKLQETQMSTTSKLEEAEHKVQTLQTGVLSVIPVQSIQGRPKGWGGLWAFSQVPPPQAPAGTGCPEGVTPESPQPLRFDSISHPP